MCKAMACNEGTAFDMCFLKAALNDEGITLDIKEQFKQGQQDKDLRKNKEDVLPTRKNEIKDMWTEYPGSKTSVIDDEDTDVVDREDHFTQHLSDLLVNTDSEITSLQASEVDEGSEQAKEEGLSHFVHEKKFDDERWLNTLNIIQDSEMYNY